MADLDSTPDPVSRPLVLDLRPASAKASIEVRYAKQYFRSMLEARYAVFFDILKIAWYYEPRTFFSHRERLAYKPDFYLPQMHCWIELKGKPPSTLELSKIAVLREQMAARDRLFVLVGPLPDDVSGFDPQLDWQRPAADIYRALNISRGWRFENKNKRASPALLGGIR